MCVCVCVLAFEFCVFVYAKIARFTCTTPLQEWSVAGPPPDGGQRSECDRTQGQGRRWGVLSEPSYSHHHHHARLCIQPPHEEVSRPPQQHNIACTAFTPSWGAFQLTQVVLSSDSCAIAVSMLCIVLWQPFMTISLSLQHGLLPQEADGPLHPWRLNCSANTQTLPNLPLFILFEV